MKPGGAGWRQSPVLRSCEAIPQDQGLATISADLVSTRPSQEYEARNVGFAARPGRECCLEVSQHSRVDERCKMSTTAFTVADAEQTERDGDAPMPSLTAPTSRNAAAINMILVTRVKLRPDQGGPAVCTWEDRLLLLTTKTGRLTTRRRIIISQLSKQDVLETGTSLIWLWQPLPARDSRGQGLFILLCLVQHG